MSRAIAQATLPKPIAASRLHTWLRFSTGITIAFILSEAMGWSPTFLAPVLFAVLATSIPVAPPLKMGLGLFLIMAATATLAFLLSTLLQGTPHILVGAIAVLVFVAFAAIAQGRGKLPATFLLLCISTIPVLAIVAPAQAGVMPLAMARSMAVGVLVLWCMHAIWPKVAAGTAPPPPAIPNAAPLQAALVGTAVVMPVMLIYLLFGLADALPVLVTVVMLITAFDPRQGAMQGLGMIMGNLVGGLVALMAFFLLSLAPSLPTLGLITFLMTSVFAIRIDQGGSGAALALLTCNSSLIILSTAIADPMSSSGVWATRLFQFALACLFAIGMMSVVWGARARAPA
jgi:hypothetical protein